MLVLFYFNTSTPLTFTSGLNLSVSSKLIILVSFLQNLLPYDYWLYCQENLNKILQVLVTSQSEDGTKLKINFGLVVNISLSWYLCLTSPNPFTRFVHCHYVSESIMPMEVGLRGLMNYLPTRLCLHISQFLFPRCLFRSPVCSVSLNCFIILK